MSNPIHKLNNIRFTIFLLFIPVIVSFLFAFMFLNEFYIVKIKQEYGAYPFDDYAVWWYRNNEVYWKRNLVTGLVFLITSVATTIFIIKGRKKLIIWGILLLILSMIYVFIDTPTAD